MEPDFVTRQHLDSLGNGDPSLSELLNRYKNIGQVPTLSNPSSVPTHSQSSHGGDAILLSNILGQIHASLQSLQKSEQKSNLDGLQLTINSDVFKWILLFLFVLILVYLFLKSNSNSNRLDKKIDKLHGQLKTLKSYKAKRRNPDREIKSDLPVDLETGDLSYDSVDADDSDYDLGDDL